MIKTNRPRATAVFAAGLVAAPVMAFGLAVAQTPGQTAPFTAAQATLGRSAYDDSCAGCHGQALEGSGPAVALKGTAFMAKYGGQPVEKLHADVRRMPPGAASSIDL